MKLVSDIVLKSLGIWLFILAYAKGWQLLSEPIIDNYIWTHRPFELVLAIWLLSGKSRKYAWLATLLCYCLFSVVPLYKGITSVEFCSCFGSAYTSSWKTFLAFYLPAITALLVFRPKDEKSFTWTVLSHHHNYLICDQNCQLLKRINQNIHISSAFEKRMTEYENRT